MQQSRLDDQSSPEEKGNAPVSEDIDLLVSSFLADLANISSDERGTRSIESIENQPVEHAQVEAVEKPSVETPAESEPEMTIAAQAEESTAGLGIDFDSINKEIEESLSELERLKSKVVPITDRRDTRAVPAALDATAAGVSSPGIGAESPVVERPASAPAARPTAEVPVARPAVIKSAKPSIMPESPEAEELAWDRLEIFRSQIATPKPRQWLKPAIGICILLIVLAVSAYQLFRLRSTQNSRNPDHSVSDTSKARVKAESIAKVQPEYPRLPRKQRVAGTVVLEADIDEKGDVVRAKAISGPDQLRKAAEEALMKWKFKPASVNGIAIASKEQISIVLEPPK